MGHFNPQLFGAFFQIKTDYFSDKFLSKQYAFPYLCPFYFFEYVLVVCVNSKICCIKSAVSGI